MIKSKISKNKSFYQIYRNSLKFLKSLNEKISDLNFSSLNQQEQVNLNDQIYELEKYVINFNMNGFISPKWLSNIAISSFTHMEFIFLSKLKKKLSFTEIFSKEFLCILFLTNSSALFLLATENRFICKNTIQNNFNLSKIKPVFPQNIKFKLQKMKKFNLSKAIHSKALYILKTFFVEDFPLKRHLYYSFIRNYNVENQLEYISKVK